MTFRYWISPALWLNRSVLWLLFWTNLLGTVYGYIWYGDQLQFTTDFLPVWNLPFVPDSPTASLFFTMSIGILLWQMKADQSHKGTSIGGNMRGIVDAFGAVTSVKYGIWAVAMIVAAAMQGNELNWQDWMLMGSHLGMAVEACLYVRFFKIQWFHLVIVGVWLFVNDYLDYNVYQIFPWLPDVLTDDLYQIAFFTIGLSIISLIGIAVIYTIGTKKRTSSV